MTILLTNYELPQSTQKETLKFVVLHTISKFISPNIHILLFSGNPDIKVLE